MIDLKNWILFSLIGLLIQLNDVNASIKEEEIHFVIQPEFEYVTYGSLIKLQNYEIDYQINTLSANYPNNGQSSGQQAVTAKKFEAGSGGVHFLIKESHQETPKERGTPIKCGSLIRLFHRQTQTYIHSHSAHSAIISGFQEISAFGQGDAGDDWIVECGDSKTLKNNKNKNTTENHYWKREDPVGFKHKDTGKYICTGKSYEYENVIEGQLEIFGHDNRESGTDWVATLGVYYEVLKNKLQNDGFNNNVREEL